MSGTAPDGREKKTNDTKLVQHGWPGLKEVARSVSSGEQCKLDEHADASVTHKSNEDEKNLMKVCGHGEIEWPSATSRNLLGSHLQKL